MQRTIFSHCNKGKIDIGGGGGGELNFGLLGSLADTLHGGQIPGQIHPLRPTEFLQQIGGNRSIKIVAAQVVVTGSCENLYDTLSNFDDGDIEGAAAQIIDHNLLRSSMIQAIG